MRDFELTDDGEGMGTLRNCVELLVFAAWAVTLVALAGTLVARNVSEGKLQRTETKGALK